jgi:hypothetical protein
LPVIATPEMPFVIVAARRVERVNLLPSNAVGVVVHLDHRGVRRDARALRVEAEGVVAHDEADRRETSSAKLPEVPVLSGEDAVLDQHPGRRLRGARAGDACGRRRAHRQVEVAAAEGEAVAGRGVAHGLLPRDAEEADVEEREVRRGAAPPRRSTPAR